ncbi:ABC transporter permease subunit [Nissabacter sp. SGAir0207]|uniref:ABC transporter permease subunit n=1 Tax=Nissabacter sp. SGAir0207 TaxID=2126321 RepID=UPI001F108B68|nr:ABC transporter permease subunit [Nissabacter sp. SGAir0207]
MHIRDLPLSSDRRRARTDRLVRYAVTGCGMLVLLALMLIFIYLLYSVWPLFRTVCVNQPVTLRVDTSTPSLAIGTLPDRRWGYRLDSAGQGTFIRLTPSEEAPLTTPLAAAPLASLARNAGAQPMYALGGQDGRVTLVTPLMPLPHHGPSWSFPLGRTPQVVDPAGQPLVKLALAAGEGQATRLAAVTADRRLWVRDLPSGREETLPLAALPDTLALTPDGRLLFVQSGPLMQIYALNHATLRLRQTVVLAERGPVSVTLLSGGNSLLVNAGGQLSQWFDVAGPNGPVLQKIRDFQPQGVARVAAETSRRVFVALDAHGQMTLNSTVQTRPQLHHALPAATERLAFAPLGDGLLVEQPGGWISLHVTNPYPDVGLRTLWQKVWYEGYPEPAYVWQTTSAAEGYQPKFSLVPVIVGTLKAALCAMLFAAPLALGGAAYTAWFMTPRLRRLVKPALEVMGALPTVVIGLIAGVWLAPLLQHVLLGILLLPWLLAAVALLGSVLAVRQRWRSAGQEVFCLLPLLALVTWLVCHASPWFEQMLFGMPFAQWLGEEYQPRNTLVAGIAMGFALVPVIFTLAEDALFSVPPLLGQGSLALGATPWQTLRRVIVPAAAAGIFSALMIGFGRAVGETMIVLMATGNTPVMDGSLLQGLRALSANIAIELPEAVANSGHYRVLMLTALVLFLFTFVLNTVAELIRQRLRARYSQNQEGA